MTGSERILSATVLLTLFLISSNLVMAQSSLTDDEVGVVRAVLEAELVKQAGSFENIPQLSTDSIPLLISPKVITDLKLTPLSLSEINVKASSLIGARYLRFTSFNLEDSRAVVTLSVIKEVSPCFGPRQKKLQNVTYSVTKVGGHWRAELTSNPRPSFTFGTGKLTFGKSL